MEHASRSHVGVEGRVPRKWETNDAAVVIARARRVGRMANEATAACARAAGGAIAACARACHGWIRAPRSADARLRTQAAQNTRAPAAR
eukprot:6211059-Pleurochrysis_carterae.AAC.4